MPSPFPGMDPYLEAPARWGGVHTSLIVEIRNELNAALPRGVVAAIDEYVWIEEQDAEGDVHRRRPVKPDVFLPDAPFRNGSAATAVLSAPTAEAAVRPAARRRRRYIRVVRATDERLLTVIELVSPSNKSAGPDRVAYRQKRAEYLASVNFVEIDLLRAGPRPRLGVGPEPRDYYVYAVRTGPSPRAALWTWGVREPAPVPGVPLTPDVPPVPLALRRALDRAYDGGRYGDVLRYDQPPDPPLEPADAAWAASLLATVEGR